MELLSLDPTRLREAEIADLKAHFSAGKINLEEFEAELEKIESPSGRSYCCRSCEYPLRELLITTMNEPPFQFGSPPILIGRIADRRRQKREDRLQAEYGPRSSAWLLTCPECQTKQVFRFASIRPS